MFKLTIYIIYCFLSDLSLILRSPSNWPVSLGLWILYSCKNPYRLAKKRGFTYGRTPLKVWRVVASYLKQGQTLADLGSGTGLGLFYISKLFKIKCIGIDLVDEFVLTGNFLAARYCYGDVSFIKADLAQEPLPQVEALYLAGTCMSDQLLETIVFECKRIKPKIIFSISTSLQEYGLQNYQVEEKPIQMPWGQTCIYIMTLLE